MYLRVPRACNNHYRKIFRTREQVVMLHKYFLRVQHFDNIGVLRVNVLFMESGDAERETYNYNVTQARIYNKVKLFKLLINV